MEKTANDSDNSLPDVYGYLDFRKFLSDWFVAKKAANPRYSYRVFARAAGQRSSSLLHHVTSGKRNLTASNIEAFSRAMKLRADESTFFASLVQLDQARNDNERNAAWERIAATKRFREARPIEGKGVEYLSHWYYPAIRELAHRADFQADAEWVARTLCPQISVSKARRALTTLVDLGLLVRVDNTLRPAEASIATPHEVAWLAVHNYHYGMLDRARDSIAAFPPAERHLGGLTLAVPSELVPRLKEEIASFEERILAICDDAAHRSDRVYQLNLQFFPLSAAPEEG